MPCYLKYVLHSSAALIVFSVLVIGTGMILKARLDKIIDLGSRQLPHLNLSDAGILKIPLLNENPVAGGFVHVIIINTLEDFVALLKNISNITDVLNVNVGSLLPNVSIINSNLLNFINLSNSVCSNLNPSSLLLPLPIINTTPSPNLGPAFGLLR